MNSTLSRKVNIKFDNNPSPYHYFIYKISKKYIKNKVVLDVGCWSGQYIQLASNITKKVFGIDPNAKAIKLARQQNPNSTFKVGNVLKIPFQNSYFDVVIFSEVIEHIPKDTEEKAIQEIKRVLKPNGLLFLTTPRNHLISIFLDPAYFLIGHRHYSEKALGNLIKLQNFKIKKIMIYRGILNLIVSNIETLFKYTLHRKPTFTNSFNKALEKDLSKGFASLCIIAQKK